MIGKRNTNCISCGDQFYPKYSTPNEFDEIIKSSNQLSPKYKNKRKNSILPSTMALKKMRNTQSFMSEKPELTVSQLMKSNQD